MPIRSFLLGLLALTLYAGSAQAVAPTEVPVRHARVNGADLGYRVLNPKATGRPLMLVCGYGVTMAGWHPRLVEELARRRRVILFDNRGMGHSTGPVKGLTVRRMAIDAIRLIRHLGIRRVDLLGWSMGGYIAQTVAIQRPKMVGRVVLAGTDPGSPKTVEPSARVVKILTGATDPTELIPILFPRSKLAAGNAWIRAISTQPNLTAEDFSTPVLTLQQQALANADRWLNPGKGVYGALGRLTARTLIAHGARDVVVPSANARILKRRIRNSRTMIFPNAGHGFLFQSPRAKARRFVAFLN